MGFIKNIDFEKLNKFFFFSTLFLMVFSFGFRFHNFDYDLWARLIQGQHVYYNFHPATSDFYSFTQTHTWYDPEWISSWIIFLIQKNFNAIGLVVFNCLSFYLFLCLIVAVLDKLKVKNSPYNLFYYFLICLIVTLSGVLISFPRCQIFTFIFFTAWLYLLEKIRSGKIGYTFFLPFLMLIWLNSHGGCIAGVGVLFLYIIGEFLNKKPIKPFVLSFLVCFLMFLINPWGVDYYKFIYDSAIIDRSLISEWNTFFDVIPMLFNPYFYFLFFALSSYVFQIFKTKQNIFSIDKTKIILVITLSYLSVIHLKHIVLAIILFSIFLYDDMMETLKVLFGWLNKTFAKIAKIIFYFVLFCYSSLVLLVYSFDAVFKNDFFEKYPVRAMEFLKNNNYSGKIFTHFHYGSFIGYKYFPNFKIHMDGRQEQVYDSNLIKEQFRFVHKKNNFELLNKYSPDFILIDKIYFANYGLLNNNDYFLLYDDKKVNIFALNKHKKEKYVKVQLDKEKYIQDIFKTNVNFKKD